VLQREKKQGVSPALTLIAYLTVLAIALALIALISWSLLRVDRGEGRAPRTGRTQRSRAELV
jgi:flagellar biogenesis protein FliO